MPVIVRYESGFDTKLVKAARLEALINEKGEPKFDPARNVWAWEDGTTYVLKQPFAGDKRKMVYCICHSNVGSLYVKDGTDKLFVRDMDVPDSAR